MKSVICKKLLQVAYKWLKSEEEFANLYVKDCNDWVPELPKSSAGINDLVLQIGLVFMVFHTD